MMAAEEEISYIDSRLSSMDSDPNASFNEIRNLKSQRNALQPINKAPVEVLLHIFIPVLPRIHPHYLWSSHYYRTCLKITHVCRHWRNIALGCPKIWSKAVYVDDIKVDLIGLFLERSSMADIEVALGEQGNPVHSDALKLLRGRMHRVSSIYLTTAAGNSELTQELLLQCGPRLKYLYLDIMDQEMGHQVDILSHLPQTIQLEELDIKGISLPWNSSILQGLSSLTVSYRDGETFLLTLSNLLDVLEACPMLRDLIIWNVYIGTTQNPRRRSIKLPYLKTVILQDMDFKAYQNLSDCVIIPKDVEWTVVCCDVPIEKPEVFISNFPERTEQCKSFNIMFLDSYLEITSYGYLDPITTVCYNWDHIPAPQLMSDLLISMTKMLIAQPFWNNPIAVEIYSLLDYDVAHEAFWSTILALLPHIRSLCITVSSSLEHLPFLKGLIGALTEPTDRNPQSTVWPCPDLEKLEFNRLKFFTHEAQQLYKKLVNHLQLRRDHGQGIHELEFRYCYGITDEQVDELRRSNIAREITVYGPKTDFGML